MKDTVFQQLLKPLTKALLAACTTRFQSDYDCETFKTWEHLQTMIYAHVHEIKSLRTLEVALHNQPIGLKVHVKRSTLSDANRRRSVECFVWLLQQLLTLLPRQKRRDVNKVVKLLDSSPFSLKGNGYDQWAKTYSTAHWRGIKLHAEFDLTLNTASQVALSYANYNDVTMGQRWPILKDTVYVFDKGYCDYDWWWKIHQQGAYFVTRLKKNVAFTMKANREVQGDCIQEDGSFVFKNKHSRGGKKNHYTENLRRICVKREGKAPLILVTNLQELPAECIAQLYKARWEIELFFKWIKQHLKLKTFLGKSANAVKIQLVTALITYLLIKIYKIVTNDNRSLHYVLVWIRHNLQVKLNNDIKNTGPPVYRYFNPIFSGEIG